MKRINQILSILLSLFLMFPSHLFSVNTLAPAGMAETGLLDDDSERIPVLVNIAVENDIVPTRIQALEELLSFEAAISVDDIDRLATRVETDWKDKNKTAAILAAELVMMNIQTLDIEKYLKVSEKLMEVTENGLRVYEGVIHVIVGQILLNLGKEFFEKNDYKNAHRCYALVVKIKKFAHTNASTIRENAADALCDLAETIKDKSDLTDLYKSSLFLVLQYAGKEYSFNRALDKAVDLLTDVPMSSHVLELIDIVLRRPDLIRKSTIFNVIVQAVNDYLGAETVIKKLTKALPEVELFYQPNFAKLLGAIGKKIIDSSSVLACDALIICLHQGFTDDSKEAAELIAGLAVTKNSKGFNALCHALQDTREDVSQEVAKQLGLLRNPKAVEHLIPVMFSNYPKSAPEAAQALGLIGTENAINALINMIRFRTSIFYITGTRIAAIKALGVALSNMSKASTSGEAIHNQVLRDKGIETLIAASRWGREAIFTQATHTLVSVSGKSEVINRIFANQNSLFRHKRLTAVEAMGEFVNKWNTPEHRDEFMSIVQQDKINKRLLKALHDKKDKQMREKAIEAFDKANFHTAIIPLLEVIKTKDDFDVFSKAVETVAHLVEKNDIDTIKGSYLEVIYDTFSRAYQKGDDTIKGEIQKGAEQISKVLDANGLQATAASFVKIYEPNMHISDYVLQST